MSSRLDRLKVGIRRYHDFSETVQGVDLGTASAREVVMPAQHFSGATASLAGVFQHN